MFSFADGQFTIWLTVFSQNIAMGLVLILAYSAIRTAFGVERREITAAIIGLLFGCSAIVSMNYPIVTPQGLSVDARIVFILVGSIFGGPIGASIAAVLASAYRLWIGGPGAVAGVATIVISATVGAVVALRHGDKVRDFSFAELAFIGLINTAITALAIRAILALRGFGAMPQSSEIAGLITFPLGTALLGATLGMTQYRVWWQTQRRLSDIVETMSDLVWEMDASGRLTFGSPRYLDLLGYGAAEYLARALEEAEAPAGAKERSEDRAKAIAARSPFSDFRVVVPARDGAQLYLSVTGRPVVDERGRYRGYRGTMTDITERMRAERELRAREEQLSRNREHMALAQRIGAIGSAEIDIRTRQVFWSDEHYRLLGYRPGEIGTSGPEFLRHIHPEDREFVAELVRQAEEGVAAQPAEFRVLRRDGSLCWVRRQVALFADTAGRADRAVITLQDVTERKNADERLRLAATVFTDSQEGVLVTSPDHVIVAANPAASAIVGYAEDELVGRNIDILRADRPGAVPDRDIIETTATVGYWQGEIWNRRKNGEVFPLWLTVSAVRDERGKLVNYVATFIDITRVKQSEAQLEHLAHHDLLTGLPNRLMLQTQLGQAIGRSKRSGMRGAVLFLDLDRFKNVNDSYGHPMGDEVLRNVAKRYLLRLRVADTLARMGGDEFVVLIEDVPDVQKVAILAQALIEETAAPIVLSGGREVYVGTSIGISIFPDDADAADQVIRNADSAMYQAKTAGRGTFRFYTTEMTDAANARVEMEAKLRRAIEREELVLHYQPLISFLDSRVTGAEALVRWQNPSGELILPDRFIPLTEETGLIIPLGHWVLRNACAQMKKWLDEGATLDTISVNLSPVQFRRPDIADMIQSALEETGLPPRCLELEMTESTLMEFGADAEARLDALKTLGVRLAIDDFGTGYSSLAYLKRFPIDRLKIDQSFVRGVPDDRADVEIISAMVSMVQKLRMETIAEGVETQAQLEFLLQLGCHAAQGYLFGRPLPPDEWAARWKARVRVA